MLLRNRTETDDIDQDEIKCPIRQILGRMGGRWTLDIVILLESGPRHFADLDRAIPKVSRRMLTLTLRALERDGLISRSSDRSMTNYELTPLGHELAQHFHTMTEWSRKRREAIYAARNSYDRVNRNN